MLYQELRERKAREAAPVAEFPPNMPSPDMPKGAFSHIMDPKGNFTIVHGDQTLSTGSNNNTSTNSGNVTNITTTNSNNNSSVRNIGGEVIFGSGTWFVADCVRQSIAKRRRGR